ncbi:MAG: FlgD immunoglobulin-like domain containing protein [Candidatus Omnitrophota bacterium]
MLKKIILLSLLLLTLVSSPLFADTIISSNIAGNTTWTLANSPYIVTGDIQVAYEGPWYWGARAVLTIQPGVLVKFEPGAGLVIGNGAAGGLQAVGTTEQPITFTSNAATPAPGDWKGIYFHNNTVQTNLDHTIVEYGGHTNNANLYFEGTSPPVINSTIRFSSGDGIYANDTSVPALSNLAINDNTFYPVNIHATTVDSLGLLSASGNGQGDIVKLRSTGTIGASTAWPYTSIPYLVASDIEVAYIGPWYNGARAVLTIQPGVTVKFDPGAGLFMGINNAGGLQAVGTTEQPITFTSNAATPTPGDWKGLYFGTGTVQTNLDHTIVEYGGNTNNANVYFNGTSPLMTNSTIRSGSGDGIYANDTSVPALSNLTINDNAFYPVNIHATTVDSLGLLSASGNGQGDIVKLRSAGTIGASTPWPYTSIPYLVTSDIEVAYIGPWYNGARAVLTIQPGVTVKFDPGAGLFIGGGHDGGLQAVGTAEQPITFTSNAVTPAPGDWKGIYFQSNTVQTNLDHTIIEYGGNTNNANIYLNGTFFAITNSVIRLGSGDGIYASDGSVPALSNLTIDDNALYPVNIHASNVDSLGLLSASGNGQGDMITLRSAGAIGSSTLWPYTSIPYLVTSDIEVAYTGQWYWGARAVLTVQPGITVKFDPGAGLFIGVNHDGGLQAMGTTEQPITFTSNAATPAPGDWKGIYFGTGTVEANLVHAIIEYGGNTNNANLYFNGTSFPVVNSTIQYSSGYGIYLNNASLNLSALTIRNGLNDGIHLSGASALSLTNSAIENNSGDGIELNETSSLALMHSAVQNNSGYALNSASSQSLSANYLNIASNGGGINATAGNINASYVWWEDVFGPSGAGPGTGQSVSTNVTYEPWCAEPVNDTFYFSNVAPSLPQFNQNSDITVLHAQLAQNANWQATIRNSDLQAVKNFSGAGSIIDQPWGGDDSNDQPLPNGTYFYMISAQSTQNPETTTSVAGRITLDDSLPLHILNNSVSQRFFKPRLHTTTSIQYTLRFNANTTIQINNSSGNIVRTLINSELRSAGDYAENWNGTDDNGQLLPDGIYTYTIDAQAIIGGEAQYSPPPTSEHVPLTSVTFAPEPFSPERGERLAISYNVAVPAKVKFGINFWAFASDKPSEGTGNIVYWNGRNDQGQFSDSVQIVSQSLRLPENFIAIVDDRTLDISALTTDPYLIKPVYNEVTTITYTINEPASVTTKIISQNGSQIIRVAEENVQREAGTYSVIWDGRSTSGETVTTPADYRVRVEAIDNYGKITIRDGNIRIAY